MKMPVDPAPLHDHPLRGQPHPDHPWHPRLYLSEFVGTALLVAIGLSIVIALWAPGAPLKDLPITILQRRVLNGLLFGTTGALVSISAIGRISGSHINPAVTFAFWLKGRIKWRDAVCYVIAQLLGGVTGAACLLAWGGVGAGDSYGASLPSHNFPLWIDCTGEVLCGFLLVALIFLMASHKATKHWTPWINPPLFALLNLFESPLSGASANPARSLGPAVIADTWAEQWIYIAGPCLGAALAVGALRLEVIGRHQPHEARTGRFSEVK